MDEDCKSALGCSRYRGPLHRSGDPPSSRTSTGAGRRSARWPPRPAFGVRIADCPQDCAQDRARVGLGGAHAHGAVPGTAGGGICAGGAVDHRLAGAGRAASWHEGRPRPARQRAIPGSIPARCLLRRRILREGSASDSGVQMTTPPIAKAPLTIAALRCEAVARTLSSPGSIRVLSVLVGHLAASPRGLWRESRCGKPLLATDGLVHDVCGRLEQLITASGRRRTRWAFWSIDAELRTRSSPRRAMLRRTRSARARTANRGDMRASDTRPSSSTKRCNVAAEPSPAAVSADEQPSAVDLQALRPPAEAASLAAGSPATTVADAAPASSAGWRAGRAVDEVQLVRRHERHPVLRVSPGVLPKMCTGAHARAVELEQRELAALAALRS